MTTIVVDGDSIGVSVDTEASLLTGVHRAMLETLLGLSLRDNPPGYFASDVERVGELVESICSYLDEQDIPYQLDDNATRIAERARAAQGQLAEAIAAGREALANTEAPAAIGGFARVLLPHQWQPVRHLIAVRNAANFSVMGSGKTTVVLAAFQELRNRGLVDCLLIVGPGSAFLPWNDESNACLASPPSIVKLSGSREDRVDRYQEARTADIILVTYQTAARDERDLVRFLRQRKVMLVLDESHYVKGGGQWANTVLSIAPEAERRVILTGTPLPNSMQDLWTQFTFLWPQQHLLGNRVHYRNQVAAQNGEQRVKERVRPLFTRVRKSDLGLPIPRNRVVKLPLGDVQKRVYETLSARVLQELALPVEDRAIVRQWRRARMVRLLQAACNPGLIADPSQEFALPPEDTLDTPFLGLVRNYTKYEVPPKILAAVDLVRRLVSQGERVILWTHFIQNIVLLLPLLEEFGALPLYGDIPREEADDEDYNRELHIRRFKEDGGSCRVLIANPGAAAESISLHRVCHHAVYLDRTFNAGQFMQSRDRIHRVGLQPDEVVTYHLLLSEGTIDEVVHARLIGKEERMLALLEDPNIPIVDLPVSTDQLSGTEDEEELDFAAVIEHLRTVTRRR